MARDNYSKDTPAADLYIAGFPCQPFSAAGTLTALTALNPSRGSLSGMSEMIVFVGSHARKDEREVAGNEVVLVACPCSESRPSLSNRVTTFLLILIDSPWASMAQPAVFFENCAKAKGVVCRMRVVRYSSDARAISKPRNPVLGLLSGVFSHICLWYVYDCVCHACQGLWLHGKNTMFFFQKTLNSWTSGMFILENVKRILSNDEGRTWELIWSTLTSLHDGAYHVEYRVLDTQDGWDWMERNLFFSLWWNLA